MRLAIVGVTGLVGREILKVIDEFNLPVDELIPVASPKSLGKEIEFRNKTYKIISIDEAISKKPHIAIYSAGSEISLKTAKLFTAEGTFVIDNSSAWRLNDDVPLVVPEVNIDKVNKNTKLIANPNCSTIQMVVVIKPLHDLYKIKQIVISTYQSVTGTGAKAVTQLFAERNNEPHEKIYPHQIDLNCFPYAGSFLENAYTTEEMKLVNETHKILNDYSIQISPTVVRIPVIGGHSESVHIEFEKEIDINLIKETLEKSNNVIVQDDVKNNIYPMPITAHGRNEVFVGRIRKDLFKNNACNLWIVADNLRKGAATNAVQIARYIYENFI